MEMTYAAIHGGDGQFGIFRALAQKLLISLSCLNFFRLKPLLVRSIALTHAINGMVNH